jgi:hypothetical protein
MNSFPRGHCRIIVCNGQACAIVIRRRHGFGDSFDVIGADENNSSRN